MPHRFLLLLMLASAPLLGAAGPARVTETTLFTSGQEGYKAFRIPSIISTRDGTLLAFAEGRKNGTSDSGDIDVVLKRSTDGGKSWSELRVIVDAGGDTVGNPCPVVDQGTGRILLPLTRNAGANTPRENELGTGVGTREVLLVFSDDDGVKWSEPRDITAGGKRPDWTWYATGPGVGIQLNAGPKKGRLVIPCDHRARGARSVDDSRSHVIFSDDHGDTWAVGGVAPEKTNECQLVELANGELLLNMRSYHGRNRRALATSRDGGESWSELWFDDALIEPICQAALIRVPSPEDATKPLLLFSNPASTKRERMTVRLSPDQGRTWPVSKLLYEGPCAYSSLVALPDGQVGCLYEKDKYESIVLARLSLSWLLDAGR